MPVRANLRCSFATSGEVTLLTILSMIPRRPVKCGFVERLTSQCLFPKTIKRNFSQLTQFNPHLLEIRILSYDAKIDFLYGDM